MINILQPLMSFQWHSQFLSNTRLLGLYPVYFVCKLSFSFDRLSKSRSSYCLRACIIHAFLRLIFLFGVRVDWCSQKVRRRTAWLTTTRRCSRTILTCRRESSMCFVLFAFLDLRVKISGYWVSVRSSIFWFSLDIRKHLSDGSWWIYDN